MYAVGEKDSTLETMVFGFVTPSHLSALSLQQALELSNIFLENAYKTTDRDISLVWKRN
jgi:hypothetical protein